MAGGRQENCIANNTSIDVHFPSHSISDHEDDILGAVVSAKSGGNGLNDTLAQQHSFGVVFSLVGELGHTGRVARSAGNLISGVGVLFNEVASKATAEALPEIGVRRSCQKSQGGTGQMKLHLVIFSIMIMIHKNEGI